MDGALESRTKRVEGGQVGRDGRQMGGDGMMAPMVMMVVVMMMAMMWMKARRVAGAESLENVKVLREILPSRVDNLLVVFEGVDGNK